MKILAIDPGGTTGIVYLWWDGHSEPEVMDYAEVGFDEMPEWMYACLSDNEIDLIVYERFTISPRTLQNSRQPEALYNIGGIMYLAKLRGIPLREQASADAKTAYPDSRIKSYGVKGGHANDALRHALLATHSRAVYNMCTDTDKKKKEEPDGISSEPHLAEAEE